MQYSTNLSFRDPTIHQCVSPLENPGHQNYIVEPFITARSDWDTTQQMCITKFGSVVRESSGVLVQIQCLTFNCDLSNSHLARDIQYSWILMCSQEMRFGQLCCQTEPANRKAHMSLIDHHSVLSTQVHHRLPHGLGQSTLAPGQSQKRRNDAFSCDILRQFQVLRRLSSPPLAIHDPRYTLRI
jgi:hypothetical protein